MGIINTVVLSGRLTKGAELKMAGNDLPIVNFSIAVSERVKDASSSSGWGERPNYFDVVGFGNYYKAIMPALTKGREVTIAGRLHQDRWEKEGVKYSRICVYAEECTVQRISSGAPAAENPNVSNTQAEMPQQQANEQVPQQMPGDEMPIF